MLSWVLPLLALLALASWFLSFPHPHTLPIGSNYSLRADHGTLQLRHQHETSLAFDPAGNPTIILVNSRRNPDSVQLQLSRWRPFSTAYYIAGGEIPLRNGNTATFGYIVDAYAVAHWTLLLPLLLLLTWLTRSRRLHPTRHGLCPTCGYDLRATPNRCPECGTFPQPTAQSAA